MKHLVVFLIAASAGTIGDAAAERADFYVSSQGSDAWIVNILPLESVDEGSQIAGTSSDGAYALNQLHFLKDTESCWVENVLEELDEPGEWALNTKEGKLYL